MAVEENKVGGNIYWRIWDKVHQKYTGESFHHRDKKRAMEWADRTALKRRDGATAIINKTVTLARAVRLYLEFRTRQKSPATQAEDHRRAEMFLRVLGAAFVVTALSYALLARFVELRLTGAIDARGNPVPVEDRKPVRVRTVEADLRWLMAVLNWARNWKTPDGDFLIKENPIRGFEIPKEKNPRRPIATRDRYEHVLAVSDQVMMEDRTRGRRQVKISHLPELLPIVKGTGRRISAVCQLTYEDLHLDQGPHGSIRWPASTDKMGLASVVPIGPEVRAAIDRILAERPGIGKAYLFPSPIDPDKPIRYELASDWLLRAEKLAGLEKQKGGLWHPYRRMWATERKHLPDVDVAAAGGWSDPNTLRLIYQQPDEATMLRVVLEAGELREQKS